MKMLSFLILTIIFIRIKEVHNHQCGADDLNIRPKPLKIKSAIKNNLVKSNSYSPISIGYDFSSFIKPDSMKYLKKHVLNLANYYKSFTKK